MKQANFTTECPLWPDHPHRCKVILALQLTFSSVSLFGCLFVVMVIWLFRMYQYFVQRLIDRVTITLYLTPGSSEAGKFINFY